LRNSDTAIAQAQRETKKLTARAQQNNPLSPPRQQKIAKDRREAPKAQHEQKLRKPVAKENINWLMQRAQQNSPPPAAQTKNGESQTKNPHKPNKNISLPPLKPKATKAKQIIAQAKQRQIRKITARAQQNVFPVATAQTKKQHAEAQKKTPKAELQQKAPRARRKTHIICRARPPKHFSCRHRTNE
jgi:hypothetical protein